MKRLAASALASLAFLGTQDAHAVLGGVASTIHEDQMRMSGTRRQSVVGNNVQVHEITMADGSHIREFVSPAGIVFAVTWNTRFKPKLEDLLGSHHAAYAAAAREALRQPGIKRNVVLRSGELVVHSSAYLNTFVGKAYVQSLVPSGVNADAIR